jgi:GxxExxY protein
MESPIPADNHFLEETLTYQVIGAFYAVYNTLRFGFVESVYRRALAHELKLRGLSVETEVPIDVWYKGVCVGHFRADHVVERKVLVEVKTGLSFGEADWQQVMNYLHSTRIEVSLLLYFGPKADYKRIVYSDSRKPPLLQRR